MMTDEAIIKALECCNDEDVGCCSECPLVYCNDDLEKCEKRIQQLAIDLINRQKAEIERLKAEIEETNEADREAEVQALSESKENAKFFCEAINHAKSEAIKEFAEGLKKIASEIVIGGKYKYRVVTTEGIDNLVKEMTENDFKE